MIARRTFLKYLAASPLLATTSPGRMLAAAILDEGSSSLADYLITSPADALDVFDFQRVARQVLPVAHYGYLATGTDGNETLTVDLNSGSNRVMLGQYIRADDESRRQGHRDGRRCKELPEPWRRCRLRLEPRWPC
jgi:hypothetical protein